MNTHTLWRLKIGTIFLALLVLATTALADRNEHRKHPGYVDGTPFVDLAEPRGRLIEVTLHGRLLELLTSRAFKREDDAFGAILRSLVSMHAVIADVSPSRHDAVTHELEHVAKQLERDGWERFVRVRERNGEDLVAFMHIDERGREDEIDGLVVLGFTGGASEEASELIFVNLAGIIDLDQIAIIGERFGVPSLDELPGMDEVREQHRKEVAARRQTENETPAQP